MELLASLLEILGQSDTETATSPELKKMAVTCVGWLAYCAPVEGEVHDLAKVMDAKGTVGKVGLEKTAGAEERLLVREVAGLLG